MSELLVMQVMNALPTVSNEEAIKLAAQIEEKEKQVQDEKELTCVIGRGRMAKVVKVKW